MCCFSPLLLVLHINSAASILHRVKLFFFADDVNISTKLNLSDCHLMSCTKFLLLVLNHKCSVMIFFHTNDCINYIYLTFSNNLIKNQALTLIWNLCPNMHIRIIYCKVFKLLGFINIICISTDFHLIIIKNSFSILSLFYPGILCP